MEYAFPSLVQTLLASSLPSMTRPQLLQVVDRLSSTRQALDVAKFKQELDVGSTKEAADMAKFKQALAVDGGSSRQQQADEVSSRLVGEGEDES